jgi:hypothetical protein
MNICMYIYTHTYTYIHIHIYAHKYTHHIYYCQSLVGEAMTMAKPPSGVDDVYIHTYIEICI